MNTMRAIFRFNRTDAGTVQRLLARHPGLVDNTVVYPQEPVPLSELMWRELQEDERRFFPESPAEEPGNSIHYWVRRRRITQFRRWMRVVAELPQCWHCVANASSDGIKNAAAKIGFSTVSLCCRKRSSDGMIRWLKPLGKEVAVEIVTDAATRLAEPVDGRVVGPLRVAYDTAAGFFRGRELLLQTGYLVLAGVYHRLPQSQQLALGRAARSTVFESLTKLSPVEMDASDVRFYGDLICAAFQSPSPEPTPYGQTDPDTVELTIDQPSPRE